jgi:nucleoside-diphosphate-sugar epimerase
MYIDDCVEGLVKVMAYDYQEQLNLGTDRLVTINELVDIVCKVANKNVRRRYDLSKPQSVRGRNSDNSKLKRVVRWEPTVSLEDGLAVTYRWIEQELMKAGRSK